MSSMTFTSGNLRPRNKNRSKYFRSFLPDTFPSASHLAMYLLHPVVESMKTSFHSTRAANAGPLPRICLSPPAALPCDLRSSLHAQKNAHERSPGLRQSISYFLAETNLHREALGFLPDLKSYHKMLWLRPAAPSDVRALNEAKPDIFLPCEISPRAK